jgi:hypothetical protein
LRRRIAAQWLLRFSGTHLAEAPERALYGALAGCKGALKACAPTPRDVEQIAETMGVRMSLRSEFHSLLAAGGEPPLQAFFERNTYLLTGSDYVSPRVVVSKLKLGADFVTDFAYVNPTSGATFLQLIEIEDPAKKIFTRNDQFTRGFSQALQQCNDWMLWCGKNREYLNNIFRAASKGYGPDIYITAPRALLIFGRREDINTQRRKDRWQSKVMDSRYVTIRTYDGFEERGNQMWDHSSLNSYAPKCVAYGDGSFKEKLSALSPRDD